MTDDVGRILEEEKNWIGPHSCFQIKEKFPLFPLEIKVLDSRGKVERPGICVD